MKYEGVVSVCLKCALKLDEYELVEVGGNDCVCTCKNSSAWEPVSLWCNCQCDDDVVVEVYDCSTELRIQQEFFRSKDINFNERNDIEVFNYVNFMGDFDDDVIAISVLAWEVQREVGVHCELMQLITESFDLDKCSGEDGYVWVLSE